MSVARSGWLSVKWAVPLVWNVTKVVWVCWSKSTHCLDRYLSLRLATPDRLNKRGTKVRLGWQETPGLDLRTPRQQNEWISGCCYETLVSETGLHSKYEVCRSVEFIKIWGSNVLSLILVVRRILMDYVAKLKKYNWDYNFKKYRFNMYWTCSFIFQFTNQ